MHIEWSVVQRIARMRATALRSWLTGFALLLCMGLYLFHFYLIAKYAVDVPYHDEWASFEPNQLPSGLSLGGLIAQHNEHRLATTRLLIWLQYHLNGWNLAIHQLVNFVLYGLTVLALLWLVTRETTRHAGSAVLCFMIYLLSPINWFNHSMGYQSQVHLWLLFFVLACNFLFNETEKWFDLIIGTGAAILSIYSMASGVLASLVLIGTFALRRAIRLHSAKNTPERAGGYVRAIFVLVLLGAAILFWSVDYRKPSYHPALVLPYEGRFWAYILNIIALGFGMDQVSNTLGIFCLGVILVPMLGMLSIHGRNLPTGLWRCLTLTLAVLGVLAAVAAGRVGFGIEQAKDSRNFELAMPLLPLSVVNWTIFLQKRKSLMIIAIASLWIICFVSFFDNWREFRYYRREAVQRQIGLKCLAAYYEKRGDGYCPGIFPVRLPMHLLENAKALNVSFYRRITSQPR